MTISNIQPIMGAAGHITIMPPSYSSIVQGTWAWTSNVNQWGGGYFGNSTSADADELNYKIYLAPGTYTLASCGVENTDHGIMKVYIDGTLVMTKDYYNAGGATYNVITNQTGISISSAGIKTVRVVVDGKNAGSSDYWLTLSYLALYLTG